MLANKRYHLVQLSSPDDSFASVCLKIFVGNTMLNIKRSGENADHYRIIRRAGAQLAAPAAGASMLRAGPSASAHLAAALVRAVLAPHAVAQALVGMLAFRNCSAPPGRVQEPPRPMVPPRWRWGSVFAVPGAEGGAA